METIQQLIDRKREELETQPYAIRHMTKFDWAQIVGLCREARTAGLTDDHDIRFAAVRKLARSIGLED